VRGSRRGGRRECDGKECEGSEESPLGGEGLCEREIDLMAAVGGAR
jgi:hypothetical protein